MPTFVFDMCRKKASGIDLSLLLKRRSSLSRLLPRYMNGSQHKRCSSVMKFLCLKSKVARVHWTMVFKTIFIL